ncbi:hypothetical protein GCM10028818_42230 [Spirosoma horti]
MYKLYLLILFPFLLFGQPKGVVRADKPNRPVTGSYPTGAETVLNDTTQFISIGSHMGIFEDKTGRLTFDQVRQRPEFVPSQSESFQYGFSASTYWFRFTLTNQSLENTKHWLLGLADAATLDYVDLYLVYPQGEVKHLTGGLKRAYVDRGFFATTPFFRVSLPTNESVTVYFRIESSLTIFGKVTVWDEYYNLSKGRLIIFAIWMFLGLFILRSLNSFVLARFVPDKQFRFYTACTFLLYITTLSRTGIYQILFAGFPHLLDWMHVGMGRLMPLGLASWMYTLLDKRTAFRPLRWMLLFIIVASAVGILLPFVIQNALIAEFYAMLVLLTYILFFVSVVLIWAVGQRPSLYFVLPIALCTIPFSLYQLQSLKLIPYNPAISPLALAALAIEMVSMSLVLGRIVRSYIRERITTANALMQEKVEVDKLQALDALKTQFFTNISHEFRTPLTLILGPLAELKQRFPTEASLTLIERNGNRLLSLINQLLDLSKLEAGQLKPENESGDLVAFFRTLASSFTSLAESQQIQFTFTQNETEWWTSFDRDKVEKIITNLLANAFKFTPAGKAVSLTVHYPSTSAPGTLQCIVKDTGIGIAPANLTHIFERFYQVNGQDNRPYEGTGVGLALVHELIHVVGGRIAVTSTEGIGTTFTVTLPLAERGSAAGISEPAGTSALAGGYTAINGADYTATPSLFVNHSSIAENILLIIDDNADIRAYVRTIFEADYQIIEAVDGLDGLEKATQLLPNVVICDLMMPRLDGFGFCKTLKSQEATSHIPVVMLTAKANAEDRIEGFELGADDYLTKPFNRTEIRVRVRNLVQQRQRLYERFITSPANNRPAKLLPTTQSAEPIQRTLLKAEQQFLDRLMAVVMQHLDQPDFSVETLAEGVNMSRAQLHRKLKALTNTTATELIRNTRLAKATELLQQGDLSITQVAYAVGIDNLSYFAKVFQEQYGVSPSQYGKAEKMMARTRPSPPVT